MCWKYEGEYGLCFDHLFFGDEYTSLVYILNNEYDVEIKDNFIFIDRVFSLLSSLHEDGIIAPKEKDGNSK